MIHEAYPVLFICGLVANTCFFYLGTRFYTLPRNSSTPGSSKRKKKLRNTCMCLKAQHIPGLALWLAQVRLSLTFGEGLLYCKAMPARMVPEFRTVLDGGLHPKNGKLGCAGSFHTCDAKFLVRHILQKCTACKLTAYTGKREVKENLQCLEYTNCFLTFWNLSRSNSAYFDFCSSSVSCGFQHLLTTTAHHCILIQFNQ